MSIKPIVRRHGYRLERHVYKTEDDFINTAFRIPGPRADPGNPGKSRPAIIMNHGLSGSGMHFLLEGADSLAFFFAEAGFDVWLNNNRGTIFSRDHKYLDRVSDAEQYFNFSLQDMGKYD